MDKYKQIVDKNVCNCYNDEASRADIKNLV